MERMMKPISKAWYLLPIFGGLLGGLIMFFVIKDENRESAKFGIFIGVLSTVAGMALYITLTLAALASLSN